MSPTVFYGANINWAMGATTMSIAGVTGIYQSSDQELKMDEWTARDQRGSVSAFAGYNPYEEITIEYLASDGNSAAGNAAVTYIDRGVSFTLTADAPASGSWIAQSVGFRRTNTDALKVTNKCIRYNANSVN